MSTRYLPAAVSGTKRIPIRSFYKLHLCWDYVAEQVSKAGGDPAYETLPIIGYEKSTETRKRTYLVGDFHSLAEAFANRKYPRRFFEMFASPVPCWVAIDVDGKKMSETLFNELVVKTISAVEAQAQAWGYTKTRETLVLDASIGDSKRSHHLIMGIIAKSIIEAGVLVRYALEHSDVFDRKVPEQIDMGIYGLNLSLRTAYSSGKDKSMVFVPKGELFDDTLDGFDPNMLLKTLVTYISPTIARPRILEIPDDVSRVQRHNAKRSRLVCLDDADLWEKTPEAQMGWTSSNVAYMRSALQRAILALERFAPATPTPESKSKTMPKFELKYEELNISTSGTYVLYKCGIRGYVCRVREQAHEQNQCYLHLRLPPFFPRQGFVYSAKATPVFIYCPHCNKASWYDSDLSRAAAVALDELRTRAWGTVTAPETAAPEPSSSSTTSSSSSDVADTVPSPSTGPDDDQGRRPSCPEPSEDSTPTCDVPIRPRPSSPQSSPPTTTSFV